MKKILIIGILILIALLVVVDAISTNEEQVVYSENKPGEWKRDPDNPILRDPYQNEPYESASDGHVFFHDGESYMVYSGDVDGLSSIKLAKGASMNAWEPVAGLLFNRNIENGDISKETAFYRRADNGKHHIYYIAYPDGTTYESQVFLAEADELTGPYTAYSKPVIPRGSIAGKDVYLITSPSVVEYDDVLYMVFLGWNGSPEEVSEVWSIGAISKDDGYTWSDFEVVDVPIGMEGQITKTPSGDFVAVSTGEYQGEEAIYYAKSEHPFYGWDKDSKPIVTKDNSGLEKDEIIAPQITFDPNTEKEYLFYTGADHTKGWWMMLAEK